MSAINVEIFTEEYVIIKFDLNSNLPSFIFEGNFFNILKSTTELSIICEKSVIPENFNCLKIEFNWTLMKLIGPFDFDQAGVLSDFLRPLAIAQIGILALSSFDTDYVLVKTKNITSAINVLKNNNYVCKQMYF